MGDSPLDDENARRSLELLVDALAREMKPGLLELRLAASTLRDLLDAPTPEAFALATRAFNAIDTETRRRIQARAEQAAVVYHTKSGRTVTVMEPLAPHQAKPQSSSFLQAVNSGHRKTTGAVSPKAKR